MERIVGIAVLACLPIAISGCDGLLPQESQANTVTITFVNAAADSGVSVNFFSSSDAAISSSDLTNMEISEQLAFSLDATASFQFVRACTDFQAAVVDSASLVAAPGITASTGVLVDGMDFACGNFITFTLSSPGPENLSIAVGISDTNPLSVAEPVPSDNAARGADSGSASGNANAPDKTATDKTAPDKTAPDDAAPDDAASNDAAPSSDKANSNGKSESE